MSGVIKFIIIASFFYFPSISVALTPIARTDVVPYQRIEYNSTFNFGVVAFSKEGIDRVEFTISGQGYSGGIKTATAMTNNPQLASVDTGNDGVWEYWVPIASLEFSGNGPITVTPTIYGEDTDSIVLSAVPMIVEGTAAYSHVMAWVDGTNSDGIGTVGNAADPFPTVAAAVLAAQTSNGGASNGNIIYLKNGTYSLAGISASTSTEWLTIALAAGATKESTIINTGILTTSLLKFKGITIQSQGSAAWVVHTSSDSFWIDSCRVIGSGRWVANSNPIYQNTPNYYSTNIHTYDTDYAYGYATMVRGAKIEDIGNDAFVNTPFVVNCLIDGISNGATEWHADVYQVHTNPASNRIIYNLKAIDIHYEGFFIGDTLGLSSNNAFVNILLEMREPPDPNESDHYVFDSFFLDGAWDHLLIWNCSFPSSPFSMMAEITNASFIGNYFWEFRGWDAAIGVSNPNYSVYGNSGNNIFLHNHYKQVYQQTPTCEGLTEWFPTLTCPHWYAKRPDSGEADTSTIGADVINEDYTSESFGLPVAYSALIGRTMSVVAVDVNNAPRGIMSDIGAFEFGAGGPAPTPYFGFIYNGQIW